MKVDKRVLVNGIKSILNLQNIIEMYSAEEADEIYELKVDKEVGAGLSTDAFMIYQASISTRSQITFINQINNSWH
jgi:hypothetical protein